MTKWKIYFYRNWDFIQPPIDVLHCCVPPQVGVLCVWCTNKSTLQFRHLPDQNHRTILNDIRTKILPWLLPAGFSYLCIVGIHSVCDFAGMPRCADADDDSDKMTSPYKNNWHFVCWYLFLAPLLMMMLVVIMVMMVMLVMFTRYLFQQRRNPANECWRGQVKWLQFAPDTAEHLWIEFVCLE